MQTILSIDRLSKNYGAVRAIRELSLKVQKGDVFGILGPNGSGKTTTLGIILGVTNSTSGSYAWFDSGHTHQQRKQIGAMLDKPNFYPHLNAIENLKLVADIKELKNPRVQECLEITGMIKNANRKFFTYSTGMKQRLALASTLLGSPSVLVLDEPTNGLDPEGIADVRELILNVAHEGITVILASHLLDEVQKICSHVAVIREGKKLYEGHVKSLLSGGDGIEIGSDDNLKLEGVLAQYKGAEQLEKKDDYYIVKLKQGFKASELSAFLITNGVNITHFVHNKGSLEKEFLHLLSENRD